MEEKVKNFLLSYLRKKHAAVHFEKLLNRLVMAPCNVKGFFDSKSTSERCSFFQRNSEFRMGCDGYVSVLSEQEHNASVQAQITLRGEVREKQVVALLTSYLENHSTALHFEKLAECLKSGPQALHGFFRHGVSQKLKFFKRHPEFHVDNSGYVSVLSNEEHAESVNTQLMLKTEMKEQKVVRFLVSYLKNQSTAVHFEKLVMCMKDAPAGLKGFFRLHSISNQHTFFKNHPEFHVGNNGYVSVSVNEGHNATVEVLDSHNSEISEKKQKSIVIELCASYIDNKGPVHYKELVEHLKQCPSEVRNFFSWKSSSEKLEFFKSNPLYFKVNASGGVSLASKSVKTSNSESSSENYKNSLIDKLTNHLSHFGSVYFEDLCKIDDTCKNYFESSSVHEQRAFFRKYYEYFSLSRRGNVSLANGSLITSLEPERTEQSSEEGLRSEFQWSSMLKTLNSTTTGESSSLRPHYAAALVNTSDAANAVINTVNDKPRRRPETPSPVYSSGAKVKKTTSSEANSLPNGMSKQARITESTQAEKFAESFPDTSSKTLRSRCGSENVSSECLKDISPESELETIEENKVGDSELTDIFIQVLYKRKRMSYVSLYRAVKGKVVCRKKFYNFSATEMIALIKNMPEYFTCDHEYVSLNKFLPKYNGKTQCDTTKTNSAAFIEEKADVGKHAVSVPKSGTEENDWIQVSTKRTKKMRNNGLICSNGFDSVASYSKKGEISALGSSEETGGINVLKNLPDYLSRKIVKFTCSLFKIYDNRFDKLHCEEFAEFAMYAHEEVRNFFNHSTSEEIIQFFEKQNKHFSVDAGGFVRYLAGNEQISSTVSEECQNDENWGEKDILSEKNLQLQNETTNQSKAAVSTKSVNCVGSNENGAVADEGLNFHCETSPSSSFISVTSDSFKPVDVKVVSSSIGSECSVLNVSQGIERTSSKPADIECEIYYCTNASSIYRKCGCLKCHPLKPSLGNEIIEQKHVSVDCELVDMIDKYLINFFCHIILEEESVECRSLFDRLEVSEFFGNTIAKNFVSTFYHLTSVQVNFFTRHDSYFCIDENDVALTSEVISYLERECSRNAEAYYRKKELPALDPDAALESGYRLGKLHILCLQYIIETLRFYKTMKLEELMFSVADKACIRSFFCTFSSCDTIQFFEIHHMYFCIDKDSDGDNCVSLKNTDICLSDELVSQDVFLITKYLEGFSVQFFTDILQSKHKTCFELSCALGLAPGFIMSFFAENYSGSEFCAFFYDHSEYFIVDDDHSISLKHSGTEMQSLEYPTRSSLLHNDVTTELPKFSVDSEGSEVMAVPQKCSIKSSDGTEQERTACFDGVSNGRSNDVKLLEAKNEDVLSDGESENPEVCDVLTSTSAVSKIQVSDSPVTAKKNAGQNGKKRESHLHRHCPYYVTAETVDAVGSVSDDSKTSVIPSSSRNVFSSEDVTNPNDECQFLKVNDNSFARVTTASFPEQSTENCDRKLKSLESPNMFVDVPLENVEKHKVEVPPTSAGNAKHSGAETGNASNANSFSNHVTVAVTESQNVSASPSNSFKSVTSDESCMSRDVPRTSTDSVSENCEECGDQICGTFDTRDENRVNSLADANGAESETRANRLENLNYRKRPEAENALNGSSSNTEVGPVSYNDHTFVCNLMSQITSQLKSSRKVLQDFFVTPSDVLENCSTSRNYLCSSSERLPGRVISRCLDAEKKSIDFFCRVLRNFNQSAEFSDLAHFIAAADSDVRSYFAVVDFESFFKLHQKYFIVDSRNRVILNNAPS